MKGKSYITENRELAFKRYCENGGNIEGAIRALQKDGLKLSKPTFYDWLKKYNFEERRTKVDMERQKARENQISFEDKMLNDLVRQKEKYEKYFEATDLLDNQATYAYTGIIKTIIDVKKKLAVSDVVKKAETDKAMTKEELLKMLKEDVYGLA